MARAEAAWVELAMEAAEWEEAEWEEAKWVAGAMAMGEEMAEEKDVPEHNNYTMGRYRHIQSILSLEDCIPSWSSLHAYLTREYASLAISVCMRDPAPR